MSDAFAKAPVYIVLDATGAYTLLERRLYEFLDLKAGTRGYWDDSLVAIARAIRVSRRHLGDAAKRLEEKGLIAREKRGHWRTRFVVVPRVRGQQLPLDEHPPEVGIVRRTGAPPEPVGRSDGGSDLYSDKEVFTQRSDPSAPSADRYGLATRKTGRARLDGLHERYRARLVVYGLGHPVTGEEWRRADAMVLEWARLDPRYRDGPTERTPRLGGPHETPSEVTRGVAGRARRMTGT